MSHITAGLKADNATSDYSGLARKTSIANETVGHDLSDNLCPVSGGLSRKDTSTRREKTAAKRLCGNVLEATSAVYSISVPNPRTENDGRIDMDKGKVELLDRSASTASAPRELVPNSQSNLTVSKPVNNYNMNSAMVEKPVAKASSELGVEKQPTQTIVIEAIRENIHSVKQHCLTDTVDAGSTKKVTFPTYISTDTQQGLQIQTTDPIDMQQKPVSSPKPYAENTVALYLCADWMRYRLGTPADHDQMLYEKTIVSLLPEGVWVFGGTNSGKTWNLRELWDRQDKGIIVNGSVVIRGKKQNITAEYILSVILMLVRKHHTRASGNLASSIVIGVPYWFDSRRRKQILNAAHRVEFANTRIFNDNSLSAYFAYTNQKVSKEHELIIFSVNSNKIDVSVYRSTDYATTVLVGSCGNYEGAVTSLIDKKTMKQIDPLQLMQIQLSKAITVAFQKAEVFGKTSLKRSGLICAKNELIKSQQDLLFGIANKISNMQNVHVENGASFYSLLDVASSNTFLNNDSSNNIIDGRPFKVLLHSPEHGCKTVPFDGNYICGEPTCVVIPGNFITNYIYEAYNPSIKISLGRLEIKNPVARGEILVDVRYDDNGILNFESVRGRLTRSGQHLLYDLQFEWFPENQPTRDLPWYKTLFSYKL